VWHLRIDHQAARDGLPGGPGWFAARYAVFFMA
jgi:hypothetical protein